MLRSIQPADWLPDTPRYVETRSMLLAERAELYGYRIDQLQLHFVAIDPATRFLSVVGEPGAGAVAQALENRPDVCEALVPGGELFPLAGWTRKRAILLEQTAPPCAFAVSGASAVLLEAQLLPPGLPSELRRDLIHVSSFSPLAATVVGGVPVSFCYCMSTETLFALAVDTLADYRGRGYGGVCASLLIEIMRREGKRPVWGALDDNLASKRLGEKLGFTPVDEMGVWERDAASSVAQVASPPYRP